MSIVTTCSHCRTRVRTREDAEGKRAKCPRCGQVFIVEVPSVEAAADDVPERIATNIRCGFVPRTDRRDPGLEPPDGSGDSIETPVTFKVVINRDSDCELKGAYQAALNSEGLRLSKAKANPYLIPVGTQAEYLGGNTLAVMVNSRRIEAKITKWAAYQQRLTKDVVALLKKGRALDHRGYAMEWYLFIPAILPMGIPIMTLGGAIPGAVGFSLAGGCYAIAQKEKLSVPVRILLSLALGGIGYAIFIAWILFAAMGAKPDVGQSNPAPEKVVPANQGVEQGAGQARADDAPPGVYGDQGGEEIAPADSTLPDTLLRCRAADTFYKLANAQIGKDQFGRDTIFVDYEKVKVGTIDGIVLMVHFDNGARNSVLLFGALHETRGTFSVALQFGGNPFGERPKNMELYLTRSDMRYGLTTAHFKVSNSTTIGTMPKLTRARNWTKDEMARLTKPPPNHTNANAHTGVGEDTPFGGDTVGGVGLRYVEPGGLLYGLEYRTGEWDMEKCLGGVVAIFQRDQQTTQPSRLLAKDGYAIGGIQIQSKKFVDALQLVFMRVGNNGELDPADSYTSEWVGFPVMEPAKELGGKGRRVIGIHCRQGAILNGLALVLDSEGDGKP